MNNQKVFLSLIVSFGAINLSLSAMTEDVILSGIAKLTDATRRTELAVAWYGVNKDQASIMGGPTVGVDLKKIFGGANSKEARAKAQVAFEAKRSGTGAPGTGMALDDAIKTAIANVANKTGSVEDAMKAIGRTSGRAIVVAMGPENKAKAGAAFDALKAEALK